MTIGLTDYRLLYEETRQIILDHPLTVTEIESFKQQLSSLKMPDDRLAHKLAMAYRDLIDANLTYASHQLFFVLNINHDRSTITLPISQVQLKQWQVSQSPEYKLFTTNAFMFEGLSIDETAASALL